MFANIGAGHAHTVAFTAAGSMWLWGSLQKAVPNSSGGKEGNREGVEVDDDAEDQRDDVVVDDTPRLVDTFARHKVVHGSEILCGGNQVFVRTDLGLYAIEEQGAADAAGSREQPQLTARRISTFDSRDVQSQSLVVGPMGPRIYSVVSMHPKSDLFTWWSARVFRGGMPGAHTVCAIGFYNELVNCQ